MLTGLLLGYPLVDVRATLYDGSYHDVDSSELAFKTASSICLRESKDKLGLVLLEPIMNVEVVVPDEGEYCGKSISILNSRRGSIQNIESNGKLQKVYCRCPLSEMSGFLTELRSATAGRGTYSMEFSSYEEVPKEISDEIIRKKNFSK
jgi:elongation factor G